MGRTSRWSSSRRRAHGPQPRLASREQPTLSHTTRVGKPIFSELARKKCRTSFGSHSQEPCPGGSMLRSRPGQHRCQDHQRFAAVAVVWSAASSRFRGIETNTSESSGRLRYHCTSEGLRQQAPSWTISDIQRAGGDVTENQARLSNRQKVRGELRQSRGVEVVVSCTS